MTATIGRWSDPGVLPLLDAQPYGEVVKKHAASARASAQAPIRTDEVLGPSADGFAKPTRAATGASASAAAGALERVTRSLNADQPPGHRVDLSNIAKMPIDSLIVATTLLVANGLGQVAQVKGKALEIMSAAQEKVRDLEVQQLREQIDKAIEQQQKAKKAGIFGAIFDWVVAAVEVVSGVAKMAVGAVTGNVAMVAGGAMDFLAGAAGVVKAVAETMALVDPDNAEKYKAIAEKAGYVQLAFEIAGAVVDVTSAVRNAVVAKVIPKAAEAALKEGTETLLVEAVKSGSKSTIAKTAEALGTQVAAKVAGDVAEQLGKTALEASKSVTQELARTIGVKRVIEAFSEQAIKEMVERAAKKVATEAVKAGGEITAKELTKRITKEITREVVKEVMKAAAFTAINVVRATAKGANEIISGVISIERAQLQKQMEKLMLSQQWLQVLFDEFEQKKKEATERVKQLVEGQTSALEGGSDTLKQAGRVQTQGAASLARVAMAVA